MWITIKWSVLFFCLAVLFGCQEPVVQSPEIDTSGIVGIWTVESAHRNGKLTETVKDAFFYFPMDNKMRTNILGDTLLQDISWQDSLFIPQDSLVQYKLRKLDNDTLQLAFNLQRFQFDLLLVRAVSVDSIH